MGKLELKMLALTGRYLDLTYQRMKEISNILHGKPKMIALDTQAKNVQLNQLCLFIEIGEIQRFLILWLNKHKRES
jgi:hypothetical protein